MTHKTGGTAAPLGKTGPPMLPSLDVVRLKVGVFYIFDRAANVIYPRATRTSAGGRLGVTVVAGHEKTGLAEF